MSSRVTCSFVSSLWMLYFTYGLIAGDAELRKVSLSCSQASGSRSPGRRLSLLSTDISQASVLSALD